MPFAKMFGRCSPQVKCARLYSQRFRWPRRAKRIGSWKLRITSAKSCSLFDVTFDVAGCRGMSRLMSHAENRAEAKPGFGAKLRRRQLLAAVVPQLEHFDLATLGRDAQALLANGGDRSDPAFDL